MNDDLLTKYMTPGQKKARIIKKRRAAACRWLRSRWSAEQLENERIRLEAEIAAFIAKRSEENRAA
jgi:hypothetical protein